MHSKAIGKCPHVRMQILQGKIVPLISFTKKEMAEDLHSTKFVTDNLANLKLDIHVFPHKYDIKNPQPEQCLAEGFIYIDDMLTHKYSEKNEYFLMKVQLKGDSTGKTWFVINPLCNNFKNGVVLDEKEPFEK